MSERVLPPRRRTHIRDAQANMSTEYTAQQYASATCTKVVYILTQRWRVQETSEKRCPGEATTSSNSLGCMLLERDIDTEALPTAAWRLHLHQTACTASEQ